MSKIAIELTAELATSCVDEPLSKLEYVTPCLVEYGSLVHLTQFGGSGSSDFLGMQDGMN